MMSADEGSDQAVRRNLFQDLRLGGRALGLSPKKGLCQLWRSRGATLPSPSGTAGRVPRSSGWQFGFLGGDVLG